MLVLSTGIYVRYLFTLDRQKGTTTVIKIVQMEPVPEALPTKHSYPACIGFRNKPHNNK
ncbi:9617_t:CDS:2 [Paraglomus occultum]|uniref:9617_t:CDS:1 n=1 Tax=Paraglomus occultum TaxID=144539 RepID=A0A9N9AB59_9GLOM|nr:9617_t:CDS:2 [Paraglomus occultum]